MEVGHDLGNLVGALSARLMVMEAEGALPDDSLQALKAIVEAQSGLIGRLKALARPPDEQPEPVQLLDRRGQPGHRRWWRASCSTKTERKAVWVRMDGALGPAAPGDGRPGCPGQPGDQPAGQRPRRHARGGPVLYRAARIPVGTVCLTIEDQGTGIPDDVLPRIFEPFFSTKADRGMGMGLAMARQLMRQLGGDIAARQSPRGGRRLRAEFPGNHSGAYKIEQIEKVPGVLIRTG